MKVLHTGDLHLGTQFGGLPQSIAAQRRQEQLTLLERIGELARREQVQLTLLAGDLFDTPRPPADLVRRTAAILDRFPGRLFLSPGNHDYLTPDGPYQQQLWPRQMTIFRSPRVTAAEVPELDAVVWGAAFHGPEEPDSPLADVGALPGGRRFQLLLLHGELNGATPRYAPFTGTQLAKSGACYAALGHLHVPTGLLRAGETVYAYCGCPEGRGFDEAEQAEEYGVLVGTIGEDGVALRREPVALRHVRQRTAPLTQGLSPRQAVEAVLPAGTERDLYRITLTGPSRTPPDLKQLAAELAERFYYLELRDETHPPEELWSALGERTLRGLFLAELARQRDKDPALIDQAARYGLAAFTGQKMPEEEQP